MKKINLLLLAACVLAAGCTSKEQDEKIKTFWMGQAFAVMLKVGSLKSPKAMETMPLDMLKNLHKSDSAFPAESVPTVPVATSPASASSDALRPANNTPRPKPMQVLDVTMDAEALPGKASYSERIRMKKAWTAVQESNQNLLKDIKSAFGRKVGDKAFYITVNTEQKLKHVAANVSNYNDYATAQKQILAKQEQAIKQLMEQNKANIQRIKK